MIPGVDVDHPAFAQLLRLSGAHIQHPALSLEHEIGGIALGVAKLNGPGISAQINDLKSTVASSHAGPNHDFGVADTIHDGYFLGVNCVDDLNRLTHVGFAPDRKSTRLNSSHV